jgi:DHA1 family bicyclomycin/chloramphenicol resistance-like MFS transporter
MTKKDYRILILVLGTLSAIGPFSTDMYLPAFTAIAGDLRTDIATVALSLTTYFIGISFGQLVYGPLLDRYGRKKPMILGLALYVVAAAGCAFALSIESLIAFRLLLALGGCVGIVGSRAMVRDLFSGSEMARVLSMLMVVFGVAPIVAPTVGGLVVTWLGWRFIFVVLSLLVMFMLFLVICFLKETRERDSSVSLMPTNVVARYCTVLKDPHFFIYTMAGAASSGGFFSYIAGSAFVYMDLLGFSPSAFGWLFGTNACGLIGASLINRVLLTRLTGSQVLFIITATQLAAGLLLLLGGPTGFWPKSLVLLLVFFYIFCFGFVIPNTTALALHPFTANAGSAAAMNGSLQMLAGGCASALVSLFHNGTMAPMVSIMTGCTAVGVVFLGSQLFLARRRLRSTSGCP